tara:strand:- start:231 stop:788 length:558 start_codon:yes stop_codon:yes gene_type:complete
MQRTETISEPTTLPIGSPNIPHESGGVVPTTVGFDPQTVRPFNTLLTKSPDSAFSAMLEDVYMNVYGIFPCRLGIDETNVVMFTARSTESPQGASYDPAKRAITAWEPNVFKDIGQFIFPNQILPSTPGLVSFQTVESVDYRRGSVNFVDGARGYIYTGWRLNFVFYASSLECLEEAMELVYEYD